MDRFSSKRARIASSSLLSLTILAAVSLAAAATPDGIATGSVETAAPTVASSDVASTPPTWTALYAEYMAAGTVGNCASCHTAAATPQGAYDWLAQQQYMLGTPYLVDPRTSCFSWLGGDMPPDGPSNYGRARSDFQAWAAAGASKE